MGSMERPTTRVSGPVLDTADPVRLARFYERLLGWELTRCEGPKPGNPPEDGWAVINPPGGGTKLEFQWEPNYVAPVWPPEGGQQLMMMHIDVAVDDLDSGVAWAIECGARPADHQPQDGVRVMLDPEGHVFCLFAGEV